MTKDRVENKGNKGENYCEFFEICWGNTHPTRSLVFYFELNTRFTFLNLSLTIDGCIYYSRLLFSHLIILVAHLCTIILNFCCLIIICVVLPYLLVSVLTNKWQCLIFKGLGHKRTGKLWNRLLLLVLTIL